MPFALQKQCLLLFWIALVSIRNRSHSSLRLNHAFLFLVVAVELLSFGQAALLSDANCPCPPVFDRKSSCGKDLNSTDCFKNRAYQCPEPGKTAVGSKLICYNGPCLSTSHGSLCTSYANYAKVIDNGKWQKEDDLFYSETDDHLLQKEDKLEMKYFGSTYLILEGKPVDGKPMEAKRLKRDGGPDSEKFVEV